MLSNQEYYAQKALNVTNTIGGNLMKDYYLKMVEVETPKQGIGSGEQSTQRMEVRNAAKIKAKELAKDIRVAAVAPNLLATCFIFVDGSRLRTDCFN